MPLYSSLQSHHLLDQLQVPPDEQFLPHRTMIPSSQPSILPPPPPPPINKKLMKGTCTDGTPPKKAQTDKVGTTSLPLQISAAKHICKYGCVSMRRSHRPSLWDALTRTTVASYTADPSNTMDYFEYGGRRAPLLLCVYSPWFRPYVLRLYGYRVHTAARS